MTIFCIASIGIKHEGLRTTMTVRHLPFDVTVPVSLDFTWLVARVGFVHSGF